MLHEKTLTKSVSDINLNKYRETSTKRKWKKIANKTKPRPTSRLSKSIEKSLNQDHSNDEESTQDWSIRSDNDLIMVKMINMNVCLVIGNTVQSCSLCMNPNNKVEKIIELAIKDFNDKFDSKHTLFRLIPNKAQYGLRPSRKNGFPKVDMPCFELSALVGEINTTQVTLVWRENPLDFKVYFYKKSQVVEKKKTCQECIVF